MFNHAKFNHIKFNSKIGILPVPPTFVSTRDIGIQRKTVWLEKEAKKP